jgi:hypothetical protein
MEGLLKLALTSRRAGAEYAEEFRKINQEDSYVQRKFIT